MSQFEYNSFLSKSINHFARVNVGMLDIFLKTTDMLKVETLVRCRLGLGKDQVLFYLVLLLPLTQLEHISASP